MGNSSYIYLLFTRSNTLMSRAIFWFTHDEYTHVSISADDALEDFYSFGRRVPYMMLPAGFTKESVYAGLYRSDSEMPCKLVRIKTEQGEVERIKTILGFFYRYRFQYKYSILGTVFCKLGIRYERMQHRFCSQFVSELLQECSIMQRDREPSLIKPSDLAQEPYVHTLFEGDIEGLRQWMEAMSAHPYIGSIEDYRNGLSPETKKVAAVSAADISAG